MSESRRNHGQPLTLWTWSKVVRRIALAAGVPRFSTHTTRHLCLTDLARMGWELHAIATFAGHRSTDSTLAYIHLSGRDLADKLASGMEHIHAWRVETLARLGATAGRSAAVTALNFGGVASDGRGSRLALADRPDRRCGRWSDPSRRGARRARLDRPARGSDRWSAPTAPRLAGTSPGLVAAAGRGRWPTLHHRADARVRRRGQQRRGRGLVLTRCAQLGRRYWDWPAQDWAA